MPCMLGSWRCLLLDLCSCSTLLILLTAQMIACNTVGPVGLQGPAGTAVKHRMECNDAV